MATLTTQSFPKEAYCPITYQIMKDPVFDKNGISYERSAIEEWVSRHGSSPVTRQPLSIDDLTPNLALKAIIENIQLKNQCESIQIETPKIAPQVQCFTHKNYLKIKVEYPEEQLGDNRSPTDLVLNVDLSYSMDGAASTKHDVESQMFSILSLVKHSMKTIIKGLHTCDTLTIVSFADTSAIEFMSKSMTEDSKEAAILCVERLHCKGSTNLWSGIRESYKVFEDLRVDETKGTIRELNNPTILTFTDGQSNIAPASGLMPTLQRFKRTHVTPVVMNMYGFGPNLDTDLLFESAKMFGGRFDFISDFSMVGTVFVNSLTNILMTSTPRSTIQINVSEYNNQIKKIYDPHTLTKNNCVIDSRAILYGQPREFIVEFEQDIVDFDSSDVAFIDNKGNIKSSAGKPIVSQLEIEKTLILSKLADCLESTWENTGDNIASHVIDFVDDVEKNTDLLPETKNSEWWKLAKTDIHNQILLGLQDKHYLVWGRKYIYAYYCALQFQQCNNFKDKLMSTFGSSKTRDLLEKIEEFYMDIPPPKTRKMQAVSRNDFITTSYNASGGCVHGDTLVTIMDKLVVKNIKASEVKPDMLILTRNTQTKCIEWGGVEFITKLTYNGNLIWYENDIALTAWHPVWNYQTGGYVFPNQDSRKTDTQPMSCGHWNPIAPEVFDFVLDNRGDVILGDLSLPSDQKLCMITLGHGITNDPVANHDYFGTERVVNDLRRISTETGSRILKITRMIRNPNYVENANLVNKIKFEPVNLKIC